MGIAKDLSRVKSNITAALSAIADKGVTVPDGSTSDALAGLIASIEAGGGKIFIEERTFASDATEATITHDLGELPSIMVQLMMETTSGKYTKKARIGVGYIKDGNLKGTTAYNSSTSSSFNFNNKAPFKSINEVGNTTCTFIPCGGNTAGSYYYAGDTYLFVLIGGVQV